jgi:hypothetical protein
VAIPDFQTLMRPLLVLLSDGEERSTRAIRSAFAEHFELTPEELEQRLPSGADLTFRNRVGWALTRLRLPLSPRCARADPPHLRPDHTQPPARADRVISPPITHGEPLIRRFQVRFLAGALRTSLHIAGFRTGANTFHVAGRS